jgi:recombination protein RecT
MSNAATAKKPATIADLIISQTPAIALVVGGSTPAERHRRAERFARIALTAIRQNPKLAQCTQESFAASLMTCAQLDLEPNTPQQLAHLIPYGKECTFQPGYPGLMELAYRTGKVSAFHADVVYRKEVETGLFRYTKGIDPTIHHEVDVLGDAREGEIVSAYAVAKMKDGTPIFRVIDRKDVERAKKTSASLKGEKTQYSPWNTSPDAMWMKTAIKRLCNFLPRTEQLALAIELDDKAERGESQFAELSPTTALNDALTNDATDSEGDAETGTSDDSVPIAPETVTCPNSDTQVRVAVECAKCASREGCPQFM